MGDYMSSDGEYYYNDYEDDNGDYCDDDGGDDSLVGFQALEPELLSAYANLPSIKVTRHFRFFHSSLRITFFFEFFLLFLSLITVKFIFRLQA